MWYLTWRAFPLVWIACFIVIADGAMGESPLLQMGQEHSYAEEVIPGTAMYVPGAAYITIFSRESWDFRITTDVITAGGVPASSTLTHSLGANGAFGAPTLKASGTSSVLKEQQPTGPEGQTFVVDLTLTPSWNDPPGVPIRARLQTEVSSGASMATTYVSPSRWRAGEAGPFHLWFQWVGKEEPASPVVVTVTPRNGSEYVFSIEVEVKGSGWYRIDLPGELSTGDYVYRLETAKGQIIAQGYFTVMPPEIETGFVLMNERTEDVFPHAPITERPKARLQVDPGKASPGQKAAWLVRVYNPGLFSLTETKLYLCLPRGWYVADSNHHFDAGNVDGRFCSVLFLGSVSGRSQRQVEFSLIQWPPPGFDPSGWQESERLHIYLFSRDPDTGRQVLLRETEAPLVSLHLGTTPEVRLTGVVFDDENGNGIRDAGESGVGSADIIVNGRYYRRSNRNGSFTLHLPVGTHILWARSETGRSRATVVHADVGEAEPLLVPMDMSRAAPTTSHFYVASALSDDEGGADGRHELRVYHAGPEGYAQWNVSDFKHYLRFVWSDPIHQWVVEGRDGVPEKVRMGSLRPSMPVQRAWLIGWHQPARLLPGFPSVVVSTGLEWGEAMDDYWYCQILWSGVNWSVGAARGSVDGLRAFHARTDQRGRRQESAGYVALETAGPAPYVGDGWLYGFKAYSGEHRSLSPSCGHTPQDGFHGSVSFHLPQSDGALVDRFTVAASQWSGGGRAMELSVVSGRWPLGGQSLDKVEEGPTLQVSPALQWGRDWLRIGLAAEARAADHTVNVEVGYRPLNDAEREIDVNRGEARRFVRWRWQPGDVGLSVATEVEGYAGDFRRSGEVGVTWKNPLSPGSLAGLRSSRMGLKRHHSVTRIRDDLAMDATWPHHKVRLRLTGRTPRSPADGYVYSFLTYETLQTSLSLEGKSGEAWVIGEDVSWRLNVQREASVLETHQKDSFSLLGRWRRGAWAVEAGRHGRRWAVGFDGSYFVNLQATFACRPWRLEAGIHQVIAMTTPLGMKTMPDMGAFRLHVGRSIVDRLTAFSELSLSRIDTEDLGVTWPWAITLGSGGSRSSLAVGVEWLPTSGESPGVIGMGLRFHLDQQRPLSGPGWFIHFRTPIFSPSGD